MNQQYLDAFLSPENKDVFHSVVHRHQIWKTDPFDVELIFKEARDVFDQFLARASGNPKPDYGKVLLFKGDSGCGKTHLMRAFRNQMHNNSLGYFSYMQMTTSTENYARYILNNTLASLDRPYDHTTSQTGLMKLSDIIAQEAIKISELDFKKIKNSHSEPMLLTETIIRLTDRMASNPQLHGIDLNFLRAMLYLQTDDPAIKQRIISYLRCEELSTYDRKLIGDLIPITDSDAPNRILEQIGLITSRFESTSFVICVDQLEDIYDKSQELTSKERFKQAMQTLCSLADRIPTCIVVISCLEDFYEALRVGLTASLIDRIEHDPEPILLTPARTLEEVNLIISKRLNYIYDQAELPALKDKPLFPFSDDSLRQLSGNRTRDILNYCRKLQEELAITSTPINNASDLGVKSNPSSKSKEEEQHFNKIEQAWNDFLHQFNEPIPETENELISLLNFALDSCQKEMDCGLTMGCLSHQNAIEIVINNSLEQEIEHLYVKLCNGKPQGGVLQRELERAFSDSQKSSDDQRLSKKNLVIVRTVPFPKTATSKVNEYLGLLISNGVRKCLMENSELRTILALRQFRKVNQSNKLIEKWIKFGQPLLQLPSFQNILSIEKLQNKNKFNSKSTNTNSFTHRDVTKEVTEDNVFNMSDQDEVLIDYIHLGKTIEYKAKNINIEKTSLKTHVGVLGTTGSGKTALCFSMIEQLCLSGTPCVLIDRKGDLASYASKKAWENSGNLDELKRKQFHQQVEVNVYTPGHPEGSPIHITLLPENINSLSNHERDNLIKQASYTLGAMINLKQSATDQQKIAIINSAIKILVEYTQPKEITLKSIINLLAKQDPALINDLSHSWDESLVKKLTTELDSHYRMNEYLYKKTGKQLSFRDFFNSNNGKTNLTVISTHFLENQQKAIFWVSLLLINLSEYIQNQAKEDLQGVLMLDEADIYIPAQSKPATKAPLENLLKRARSAGVGIMLATQSPGDMDYKLRDQINTWCVGRIKEETAIKKLKPLFSNYHTLPTEALARQSTGEFFLLQTDHVIQFQATPPLIWPKQVDDGELLEIARNRPVA